MYGQNVDDLVKYQMDTFGYSEDVAREEVVANSAATVLTDEEFVRNLYNNEHSLFEQIHKFFKELAETFKQLTQSASWSQDAALTPENVRTVAEVFDRVAADTAYAERENAVNSPQNKFNFVDYSEREKFGWEGSKSIVLYENDAQLDRFVQTAIDDKSIHKKLYFGKIPSELSAKVFEKTGVNVDGYNFTLRMDEIRKMLKDHGQRAKEANRGQQPITQKDFARIPTVVLNPDNIKLSDKLFEGKPVILFEKEINGRKTVVAYVTKKHMDLTVQTMYLVKKKRADPLRRVMLQASSCKRPKRLVVMLPLQR